MMRTPWMLFPEMMFRSAAVRPPITLLAELLMWMPSRPLPRSAVPATSSPR